MSTLTLTDESNDVSLEVELDGLAKRLGDEYILSKEDSEFAYLAALALETHDKDDYSVQDTLMEFIRNTSALDNINANDCDKIETILNK